MLFQLLRVHPRPHPWMARSLLQNSRPRRTITAVWLSIASPHTRGLHSVDTTKQQNPMPRQYCCGTPSADSREILTNCSAKGWSTRWIPSGWVYSATTGEVFILFIGCSTSSLMSDVTPSLFENSSSPFLLKVTLSPYQSTVVFHAAGSLVNRWC